MKKRIGKIISLCLVTVLMVTSVGYAPPAAEADKATPSTALKTTELLATSSMATPSTATPSEAESKAVFTRIKPKDPPSWYKKVEDCYTFTDREGQKQYRVYGKIGKEGEEGWFQADISGKLLDDVSEAEPVDLEWEDNYYAPYRYESALASRSSFKSLSGKLFGDEDAIFKYAREVTTETPFGQNYDGTYYDVWHIYNDSEDLKEQEFYYMYGHIVNTDDGDLLTNQWHEVNESGNVVMQEKISTAHYMLRSMLFSVSANNSYIDYSSSYDGYQKSNFYKNNKSAGILISKDSQYQKYRAVNLKGTNISSKTIKPGDTYTVPSTITTGYLLCFQLRSHGDWYEGYEGGTRLYDPSGNMVCSVTRSSSDYVTYMVVADGSCNGTWRLEQDSYAYYSESESEKEGWQFVYGGTYYIQFNNNFHSHSYDTFNYYQTEPTCTNAGTAVYSCSCGATDSRSVPALGHAWPSSYTTTANNGTYYKNCTRCGARLETKYNPYTITYHGNGNTGGDTAKSSYIYNTAKALTPNGFTKQYYSFDSWNTREDGGGTKYSNNQTINNLTGVYNGNVDLYAQWKRSSSLVTYKDWSGATLKTQEVAIGEAATPPKDPKRTGYNFYGWDKSSVNIQDHTTITAQYTINKYKLTLNGNGGTVNGSPYKEQTVVYDDPFDQELENGKDEALREGYTFDGWYTLPSGGSNYSYSGNMMPASDLTVYAHWIPNTYEVSFDSSHTRWNEGIFKEYHIFDTELGTLPTPEIYGWDFSGWWTKKDGGGERITEHSMVEPRDVTYLGNWKPEAYQIRYISEVAQPFGKSVQTFPTVQTYDKPLGTLPDPEETGYTFLGWFDDDGAKVTPETVFCPESGAKGYTYQAKWEANTYHIRFLGNHYSCEPLIAEFDGTYNTRLGILPEPKTPGYTFLGWFDDNGEEVTAESWVEPHDADYKAHWEPKKYTIHFDKNLYAVEENPDDKTVIFDDVLGNLPVLNAEGYTFTGWYTDPEEGKKVDENTPVVIGDQTYYAHWNNNTYILKLITENALNPIKEMIVVYDLALGTLPRPELEDFTFRGWYLEPYSDKAATPSEASKLKEGILLDTATPSEALKINESTVYKTATASEAYAYFDLVYREEEGNRNRRSGKDGVLDTEDDNFYFNGQDSKAGSSDDCRIDPGEDKTIGTEDDFYLYKGFRVYPGPDRTFGDLDDYMDLEDGTNLRPGKSAKWDDPGSFEVNNGYDKRPGTRDDWIWKNKELNTIRKPGPDGIFFTTDDEIWWIGKDGEPGTRDDKQIHKGIDDEYGTTDDFVDNEDGTNTRPGPDGAWGTEDDELWWNGPDGIPGTEDDELIHKGMDGKYGTEDDFIDNEDGTNTRPGPDGIWGTEDDEIWKNGPDGIPGNEDDYRYKNQNSTGTTSLKLGSDDSDDDDGWVYDASKNVWAYYYFADKNIVSNWAYLIYNGVKEWYYFDAEGKMVTGWYQDAEGKWYYLHEISDGTKGHMYRGWNEINGKWYYFNKSEGSLVSGTVTPDGYLVDETGALIN